MISFGDRLKELRRGKGIRQKDLAKGIGLGQTTIANYENNTRFPNEQTLSKLADFFSVSIDYLMGRNDTCNDYSSKLQGIVTDLADSSYDDLDKLVKVYCDCLLRGDKNLAIGMIIDSVERGINIQDIYLSILVPSLKKIGYLWETGKINVAQEHFFTSVTEMVMSLLYPYISTNKKKGYSIVTLSSNGDPHSIGVKMLGDIMEMEGWDSYYLGINVPTDSVIDILTKNHIDILAISATLPSSINSVSNIITAINMSIPSCKTKIIVGGMAFAFDEESWKITGADGYGKDILTGKEVAKKLVGVI